MAYNEYTMVLNQASYILSKRGLLSDDSSNFILNLYLPIIGSDAAFLYLYLMNEIKQNKKEGNVEDLLINTTLSRQNFLLAKQKLESIGLLTTYEKSSTESYIFLINDPETPKNFFANLVLKGLFISAVGEARYQEIINQYSFSLNVRGYKDITSNLEDSFSMNFDYETVSKDEDVVLEGRNKNTLKDNFSDVKLINYVVKHSQASASSFSEEEIKSVHRLATLYGLNESLTGELVVKSLNIMNRVGSKIDIDLLRKNAQVYVKNFTGNNIQRNTKTTDLNSTSDVGKLITYYESTSPRMFIKSKQNGIEIVDADKKIIDMLAFDMNFTNGMINALLDYSMRVTDGDLNKSYISKIAATLVRKGAKDTLGVLEILYKEKETKTKTTKVPNSTTKTKNKSQEINSKDFLDVSKIVVEDEEDLDDI